MTIGDDHLGLKNQLGLRRDQNYWRQIFWEVFPQGQYTEAVIQKEPRLYLMLGSWTWSCISDSEGMNWSRRAAGAWHCETSGEACSKGAASFAAEGAGVKVQEGSWGFGTMWHNQSPWREPRKGYWERCRLAAAETPELWRWQLLWDNHEGSNSCETELVWAYETRYTWREVELLTPFEPRSLWVPDVWHLALHHWTFFTPLVLLLCECKLCPVLPSSNKKVFNLFLDYTETHSYQKFAIL